MFAFLTAFGLPGVAILLLVLVLWLVYTGRLVPRSTVQAQEQIQSARVQEAQATAQTWRDAYLTSEAARLEEHNLIIDYASGVRTIITMLEQMNDRP